MAGEQTSGEFDEFLKQERTDAEERLNIRRIDPSTPVDRALAFVDSVQTNVKGRDTQIATMKGDLRVFRWERRTAERIWLRASDYEMVVEVADDKGNVAVTLKQYPREEGGRARGVLLDRGTQLIDVSRMAPPAIRERAGKLLIDFFTMAFT
jgi:hypothetical protein